VQSSGSEFEDELGHKDEDEEPEEVVETRKGQM
jgi:hypothetical protein